MTYKIKPYKGHLVVYIDGEFYCTADNMKEVEKEIKEYKQKRSVKNENKIAKEKLWNN